MARNTPSESEESSEPAPAAKRAKTVWNQVGTDALKKAETKRKVSKKWQDTAKELKNKQLLARSGAGSEEGAPTATTKMIGDSIEQQTGQPLSDGPVELSRPFSQPIVVSDDGGAVDHSAYHENSPMAPKLDGLLEIGAGHPMTHVAFANRRSTEKRSTHALSK